MRKWLSKIVVYCLLVFLLMQNCVQVFAMGEERIGFDYAKSAKIQETMNFEYVDVSEDIKAKNEKQRESSYMSDDEAIEYLLSQEDLSEGCRSALEQSQQHIESETGNFEQEYLLQQNVDNSSNEGIMLLSEPIIIKPAEDLSQDGHFPELIDQGELNSCGSCAVTYYQFTHAANSLNGVEYLDDTTAYSPLYPYNYLGWDSAGESSYTFLDDNYEFLQMFGGVKLSDLPYEEKYYKSWEIAENKRIEALKCRVSDYHRLEINTDVNEGGAAIRYNHDSKLMILKTYLLTGHVLVFGTKSTAGYAKNYMYSSNYPDLKVVYQTCVGYSGHAMAIVGFDDNIWCDVNENGRVDIGECGAFKVANSRGITNEGASNGGYFWILYDALNYVSQIPDFYSTKTSKNRVAALSNTETHLNEYYVMEVKNYDTKLIGVLDYNVTQRDGIRVIPMLGEKKGQYLRTSSGNYSGNYKWVFDFDSLLEEDSLSADNVEYSMGISFLDFSNNKSKVTRATFYLKDDMKNLITMKNIYSSTIENAMADVYLQKGDVNYDGKVTNDDIQIINDCLSDCSEFSSLQKTLADMDGNGVIDNEDKQQVLYKVLGIY